MHLRRETSFATLSSRQSKGTPNRMPLLLLVLVLLCVTTPTAASHNSQSAHRLLLSQPSSQGLESKQFTVDSKQGGARKLQQGVPTPIRTTAEKEAHAEAVRSMKPELLLKNLKVKEQLNMEFVPGPCEKGEDSVNSTTTVLLDASKSLVTTAAECAASCLTASKCNAWQWCDDAAGCTSEFGKKLLPKGGCQVEEQKLAPGEPLFDWTPSRFSAGYNGVASGSKLDDATQRVALIAPLVSSTCPLPFGVRSLQQSFLNRHDFARMHSFDFHLYPVSAAAAAEGTWYRFEALQKALAAIPAERAEWLLMMDQTTIVDDISFNIPLRRYAGKHLVLLGDKTLLAADEYRSRASLKLQEPLQGLDTAVILIRNSDVARKFVTEVLSWKSREAEMKTQLKTWEPLLYGQNAAALLLRDDAWRQHTVFEAEFCLACDWVHGTQGRTPFIKQFSECDFCSGVRNTREMAYECSSEQVKSFSFANRMMLEMLGCASGYKQLKRTVELIKPDMGGSSSSSSSSGTSSGGSVPAAAVKSFKTLRSGDDNGQNPAMQLVGLLRTHFFTMLFLGIFFSSFIRRRCRCW